MPSTVDIATPIAADSRGPRLQRGLVVAALLAFAAGSLFLAGQGWRYGALFIVGGLLGVSLYHAAFGFTAAYRRFLVRGESAGIQAQLLMLAVATVLFAPVLAQGTALGQGVIGAVAPVGVQVAAGAFLFGVGMQLANGCASGTLYTVGGGSIRMIATLAAFIAGSFWASLHMHWWWRLPGWGVISLGDSLGWPLAVGLQLAVFGLIALALRRWGRAVARESGGVAGWRRLLVGPWPLIWGAVTLAVLNLLTLLIAGHPWTITWAFALWGAKIAAAFGWDPSTSPFWSGGFQQSALGRSILADVTSIMDIGMILGALTAAALAGRFAPRLRGIPLPSLAAAVIGGVLMGYGARIAFGCNIGAFFSGVASTSLHGWLWIIAGLLGMMVGVKLRPFFRLPN